MNQFLMFIGTTMFITLLIVFLCPDYEKLKPDNKSDYTNKEDYNLTVWIASTFFSLMINCLVWGLIW